MEQVGNAKDPARRVLWIPGNDLAADFYQPAATLLARQGVASFLVSLPGVGGVEPMAEPSWQKFTEWLETKRKEAGAGVVLGHSMGAVLAVLMALRAGTELSGLVLVEPSLPPNLAAARRVAADYTGSVVDSQRETFRNAVRGVRRVANLQEYPSKFVEMYLASRKASDPATARALFASVEDIYPIPWHQLMLPSLVVRGSKSGPTMWMLSRFLWWQLPGGTYANIADAGHFLFGEADAGFAERTVGFIDSLSRKMGS